MADLAGDVEVRLIFVRDLEAASIVLEEAQVDGGSARGPICVFHQRLIHIVSI